MIMPKISGLYVAIGGAVLGLAVFWGIYAMGHRAGVADCNTERAQAQAGVAVAVARDLDTTNRASIIIRDIGQDLRTQLPTLKRDTKTTVDEVKRDVATRPDLANCRIPDRTFQLRQQQSAASAAAAARHRAM